MGFELRSARGAQRRRRGRRSLLAAGALLGIAAAIAQGAIVEQKKIVPGDLAGPFSNFGFSVSVSADGKTALIGGTSDGSAQDGAVWVFTRSGSTWTEQKKIIPTDQIGQASFGSSLALSANGNTALIGGRSDGSSQQGAAWVYTRSGTQWTEVQKIVPPDETIVSFDPRDAGVGWSVALSANGTVALLGGPGDNGTAGAAWVYVLSSGSWVYQKKIVPPDPSPPPHSTSAAFFGDAVALSSSGTTALIGAQGDGVTNNKGAAWVYTFSKGAWKEQKKLVPKDELANTSDFGTSAALSSNGNTALIGGPADGSRGAAWVYTRAGTTWTERQKIVPGDGMGSASEFGMAVGLSTAGTRALISGPADLNDRGAAWVYSAAGSHWREQKKLAPTDEKGGKTSRFGTSVSIAVVSNAISALIGGPADGGHKGAGWVYAGGA